MFFPKIILALSCSFFISTVNSQTLRDSLDLRRDLDSYQRVSMKLDIDSILAFMPPKMFTIAPKNRIKESLESTFINEDFTMGFDTLAYGAMLPLVKIGNQFCTMVNYNIRMSITFSGKPDSALVNILTEVFSEEYGADNVQIDPKNSARLNIKSPDKKMFALKEPGWDSWKFLEDTRADADSNQRKIMDMVIPKEVLDFFK